MLSLNNVPFSFLVLILATLAASDRVDTNGDFILSGGDTSTGVHIPMYRSSAISTRRQRQRREKDAKWEGPQVPLDDFFDMTYSIPTVIGNTAIPVVVDTGSSDLWVIANTCHSTACTQSESRVKFYPQKAPSKSCSDLDECHTGFSSTYLPASLLYGDSHTGTHADGIIGSDSLGIRSINDTEMNGFARSLPTLKRQYFAAINDTNTSVLETGCAGILGIGFPLNSALLLEIFKANHHIGPRPQSIQDYRHHHLLDVNYKRRSTKRRPQYLDRDSPYSDPLNRKTFPDLSNFSNRSSSRRDISTNFPASDRNTHSQQESRRHGKRHQVSTCSASPSPPILMSKKSRSNDDNSSPKSLLLSSFRYLGPPIWRLVTNTNKGTGSHRQTEQQPAAIQTETSCSTSCCDSSLETEKPEISPAVRLKPMFSISLQRVTNINGSGAYRYGYGSDDDEVSRGVLTIGGLPRGIGEDDLTWVEVRRYGEDDGGLPGDEAYPITWEIPIEGVYFDGIKLPESTLFDASIGVTALIDTGSSFIRGPPDVIEHINDLLRGPKTSRTDDKKESSAISCSIPHTLAFQIGGRMFPVDSRDLVYRSTGNENSETEVCYPNIAPTDVPVRNGKDGGGGYLYSWNLGDPFLKSVLASFYYGHTTHPSLDPPRIGLRSTVSIPSSIPSASSSDVDLGSEIRQDNHDGEGDDGGLSRQVCDAWCSSASDSSSARFTR